jgi:hypothetical protein
MTRTPIGVGNSRKAGVDDATAHPPAFFASGGGLNGRRQMPKDYTLAVAEALWYRIKNSPNEVITPRQLHKAIDEEYMKMRQQYLGNSSSM